MDKYSIIITIVGVLAIVFCFFLLIQIIKLSIEKNDLQKKLNSFEIQGEKIAEIRKETREETAKYHTGDSRNDFDASIDSLSN